MSREAVLGSIRDALARATPPEATAAHPGRPARPIPADPPGSLVAPFAREVEALSGRVHHAGSTGDVMGVLSSLLAGEHSRHVLAWDEPSLPLPGIRDRLEAAGVRVDVPRLPPGGDERRTMLARLAEAAIGVTGAEAGLADTGSLVLLSGPGRSRIASLLPAVHVALLSQRRLQPSLAAFLARDRTIVERGNLVLVTGPSRTADIEMILTRGVHGPRELHVVLTP